MSESEDRRRILSMLAEGKISTDEAERLLEALGPQEAAADGPEPEIIPPHKERPFFLHITIDDPTGDKAEQVNIRVPLDMVRGGMIASASIPSFAKPVRVPFDVGPKDERIERMLRALEDLELDVDEDGKKVRIFCE